jgi:predicted metal-dependent peptidase
MLISESMFFCRAWHPRRFAYSDSVVAFALPGTVKIIDAIPLFEVTEIVNMNDNEKRGDEKGKSRAISFSEEEQANKKPGDSNKVKFKNALQLHTKSDGYNSGRQYIVQAGNDEELRQMVQEITKLSKAASDKFLAKSQLDKMQAIPRLERKLFCLICTHPNYLSKFVHDMPPFT